jgi:Chaperone of endosialidase
VPVGSQVVYGGPNWQLLSAPGPWSRTGTELSPATAGDSVFTSGAVKVGGTTAAPDLQIKADGGIVANTDGLVYDAATKRLALGTSSPVQPLEVVTATGGGIALRPNAGNATQGLLFYDTGGGPYGFVKYDHQASAMSFGTNNTVRATLDSSGRLGIGTTSATATLQVSPSSGSANFQVSRGSKGLQINQDSDSADPNINVIGTTALKFLRDGGESARFDTSGRFLVGTSSSRSGWFNSRTWGNPTLQVEGTSVFNSGISVTNNSSDDNGSQLILGKSRATSVGGVTVVSSGDSVGRISFQGADGTELVAAATIEAVVDGTPGANNMPGRIVLSTTASGASIPTERMRINSNGSVGVLTGATGADNLYISSGANAGTAALLISGRHTASAVYAGTESFRVYTNGNVQNANNSYTAISDIKLKENIVDANSQWADIKALRVRNYNLKEGQTHRQIGLVAQEVETISPGLVYESPDRDADGNDLGTTTKAVQYSVLYMKAVKALQEAMERIEALEAKVKALESK